MAAIAPTSISPYSSLELPQNFKSALRELLYQSFLPDSSNASLNSSTKSSMLAALKILRKIVEDSKPALMPSKGYNKRFWNCSFEGAVTIGWFADKLAKTATTVIGLREGLTGRQIAACHKIEVKLLGLHKKASGRKVEILYSSIFFRDNFRRMKHQHSKTIFPDQAAHKLLTSDHVRILIEMDEKLKDVDCELVIRGAETDKQKAELEHQKKPRELVYAVNPYAGMSNSAPTVHANMAMNNQGQMVSNIYVSNNPVGRSWALTSPTNA